MLARCELGVLLVFSALMLCLSPSARADQITASSSLDWAAANFSSAVAPTGAGGNPASPAEGVGAFYQTLSGLPIQSCSMNAFGWTPITCDVQSENDFAFASTDSVFDSTAAASVGYTSTASVYRDGTIAVGPSGAVNIDIPFSASIAPTETGNCGASCNYFAQVEGAIFLFSTSPTAPFGNLLFQSTIDDIGYFQESDGTMSLDGPLDLSTDGLNPGTYRFEVQLTSQVSVTPEPSTIALLATGLLPLLGLFWRSRSAGARRRAAQPQQEAVA